MPRVARERGKAGVEAHAGETRAQFVEDLCDAAEKPDAAGDLEDQRVGKFNRDRRRELRGPCRDAEQVLGFSRASRCSA